MGSFGKKPPFFEAIDKRHAAALIHMAAALDQTRIHKKTNQMLKT
jgi:hypothetical protein